MLGWPEPTDKYYCPAGTGDTPLTVSSGKITVCPPSSPNGANCPKTREAEADCPAGFYCVNGTATSVKWQDANNIGICAPSDPND